MSSFSAQSGKSVNPLNCCGSGGPGFHCSALTPVPLSRGWFVGVCLTCSPILANLLLIIATNPTSVKPPPSGTHQSGKKILRLRTCYACEMNTASTDMMTSRLDCGGKFIPLGTSSGHVCIHTIGLLTDLKNIALSPSYEPKPIYPQA